MADPVVDVWANLWDRAFFEAEPLLADLYARLSMHDRARLAVADLVAEAEAGGVDKVLLSATAFPGSPANDAVAEAVARHPERLVGVAGVDPRLGLSLIHI